MVEKFGPETVTRSDPDGWVIVSIANEKPPDFLRRKRFKSEDEADAEARRWVRRRPKKRSVLTTDIRQHVGSNTDGGPDYRPFTVRTSSDEFPIAEEIDIDTDDPSIGEWLKAIHDARVAYHSLDLSTRRVAFTLLDDYDGDIRGFADVLRSAIASAQIRE